MLLNVLIIIYASLMALDFIFMISLHFFHDRKGYYKTAAGIWAGMLLGFLMDAAIAARFNDVNHIFGIVFLNITTFHMAKLTADIYGFRIPLANFLRFSLFTWVLALFMHYVVGMGFTPTALSVCIGIVAPALFSGYQILRSRKNQTIIDRLFGSLLLIDGLHILDYPFLRQLESAAVFGFSFGLGVVYLASMLIPVVINRRLSGEFSALLQKEVEAQTKKLEESAQNLSAAQAKLVYASKLASLGEMAGGIAHEINSPLGTIALRAGHVRRLLEADHVSNKKVFIFLEIIIETVKKIEDIISGLRTFSRSSDNEKFESVRIEQIILEALALCEEQFKRYEIELKIGNIPENLQIECQPAQLSQILINLLSNARHAVLSVNSAHRWVQVTVMEQESKVTIAIADSGPGVPAELQDKILHPFFTTKAIGEGTGLGLSISSGIAERHGGRLYLDKQSPHTCFVVELAKKQTKRKPSKVAA